MGEANGMSVRRCDLAVPPWWAMRAVLMLSVHLEALDGQFVYSRSRMRSVLLVV